MEELGLLKRLYQNIYLVRRFEEEIIRLYPSDKIKSPVHLSIGQESIAVGVCAALQPDDVAFGTYRGHALYLAKGGDVPRMMAELYGKVDGCARGKAGSMHLIDVGAGMMGTSAIVATTIPHAVGYAMWLKMQKSKKIVVCFHGEGAMDEGAWHESMNFAALKELPIFFVCENNNFAIYSHVRDRMKGVNVCERAAVYGVPTEHVDNGDVLATYHASVRAVEAVRAGGGPRFLECMTYRWRDHVGPGEDRIYKYRPDEELDHWIAIDQVKRLAEMLPRDERLRIETTVEAQIAASIDFAETSPYPDAAELYAGVLHD